MSKRLFFHPLLRWPLLALGVSCLLILEAWAVTAVPMSLDELVEKADIIFVGTVIESRSAWNADRTRIYTKTTFRVEDYVKGSGGETLVVETHGGVVGEVGMMVPGTPLFKVGEKNLLFLTAGGGTHHVLGWAQGRFRVQADPQTGEQLVSRPLAGVSFVRPPSEPVSKELSNLRTLDDLRTAIQRRLAGKGR